VLSQVIGRRTRPTSRCRSIPTWFSTSRASCPSSTPHSRITGTPAVTRGSAHLFEAGDERKRSADELQKLLQEQWNRSPAARVPRSSSHHCREHRGFPAIRITTTEPFRTLNDVANKGSRQAKASGMFWFVDPT